MREEELRQKQLEKEANEIIFGSAGKAMGHYPVLTRKKLAYIRRTEVYTEDFFA